MRVSACDLLGVVGVLTFIVLSSASPGACAVLQEVGGLVAAKSSLPAAETVTTISWDDVPGAISYDLLASLSPTFHSRIVLTREFLSSPQSTDTYVPVSGGVLYYLARARGASGFSTWGFHHDGTQRFFQCGDGTIAPGEECDDGNRAWADGCSGGCLVELDPMGPGGGGSPSGIVTRDADELLVAIDCGGIRRRAPLDQIWDVEKIPPGVTPEPLMPAFGSERIHTLLAEGDYLFAGTQDGRLYRWHSDSGWLLIWDDPSDPARPIGTLYFDPRFEDVLHVGTGEIQMRRFRECERHPDLFGTGQILTFAGAKSRAPVQSGVTSPGPRQLLLDGVDAMDGGTTDCPPLPAPPELPSITGLLIVDSNDTPPETLLYVSTDLGVYTATWDAGGQVFPAPERLDTGVWDRNSRRLVEARVAGVRHVVLSVDCDLVIEDGTPVCGTPGQIYRQQPGEPTWSMAMITPSDDDDSCVNGEPGCQRELWDIVADHDPDPAVQGEPSELYACDHGRRAGYLYKSVDAGANWEVHFETLDIVPDDQGGAFGTIFDCRHLSLRPENVFVAGHNNGGLWRISRIDRMDYEYMTATSQVDDPDIVSGDPAYWETRGGSFPKTINDLVFSPDASHMYATVNDWAGIVKDPASSYWRWIRDRNGSVGGGQGLDVAMSQLDPAIAVEAQSGVFEAPEMWGTMDAGMTWGVVRDSAAYPFKSGVSLAKRGVLELIIEEEADGEYLYAAGNTGDPGSDRWTVKRRRLDSIADGVCSQSGNTCVVNSNCSIPQICVGVWEDMKAEFTEGLAAVSSMDSASPANPRIFLGTDAGLYTRLRGGTWQKYVNGGSWAIADVEAVSTDEAYLALETSGPAPNKRIVYVNVDTSVQRVVDPGNLNGTTALIGDLPAALEYRPADGLLYVASRFSGIVSYDTNNGDAPAIFLDQDSGLPTNWTTAIEFDVAGVAYVGTFCQGLWRFREPSATESAYDFTGTADGGFTIQLTVDGEMLEVTTLTDQTAEEIAAEVADAITSHPTLETMGTSAYSTSVSAVGTADRIVTNGNVTSIVSNDPGISVVVVPPAP